MKKNPENMRFVGLGWLGGCVDSGYGKQIENSNDPECMPRKFMQIENNQ